MILVDDDILQTTKRNSAKVITDTDLIYTINIKLTITN